MLNPVNRYIWINVPTTDADNKESLIVLPDDYRAPEERFVRVSAVKAADDVRFDVVRDDEMVVDRSMIEEITIGATIYNVILDNYVVGIIE
jgi:hypothetical protein